MIQHEPAPHSRWRLNSSLGRLTGSYDATVAAIDTFARSARIFDGLTPPVTARAQFRAAMGRWVSIRGWPRSIWFLVTVTLAGALMGWISDRILHHFVLGTPPAVLAVTPGILLTVALASATAVVSQTLTGRQQESGHARPATRWLALLLTLSMVCWVAWLTIWLVSDVGIATIAALPAAVLCAGLAGVSFLAVSLPGPAAVKADPVRAHPVPPPRKMLAKQRKAQSRLRTHSLRWSQMAHQCGLAVKGSDVAELALSRLVSSGELTDASLTGLENFHAQILTALAQSRPDGLSTRLESASQQLRLEPC